MNSGGDSSSEASSLSSNVDKVYATGSAFAALKTDGSVATWGSSANGGDSSGVSNKLSSGVQEIAANNYAFAALKDDGTVAAWGSSQYGGSASYMHSVEKLIPGAYSFTAITQDGHALIWGKDSYSYTAYSSNGKAVDSASTFGAYAILSDTGKVTVYGRGSYSNPSASLNSTIRVAINSGVHNCVQCQFICDHQGRWDCIFMGKF